MEIEYKNSKIFIDISMLKKMNRVEQIDNITILEKRRIDLFEEALTTENNFKNIAEEVESIEYKLQECYGQERNRMKHFWWCRIPRCHCDATEQDSKYRKVQASCPFHGVSK